MNDYKERMVRLFYSCGLRFELWKRDFVGLRLKHTVNGQRFTEWPVLRPDGSVVFPGYVPLAGCQDDRSVRTVDPLHTFPDDVYCVIKQEIANGHKKAT